MYSYINIIFISMYLNANKYIVLLYGIDIKYDDSDIIKFTVQ